MPTLGAALADRNDNIAPFHQLFDLQQIESFTLPMPNQISQYLPYQHDGTLPTPQSTLTEGSWRSPAEQYGQSIIIFPASLAAGFQRHHVPTVVDPLAKEPLVVKKCMFLSE